jgi:hypothetical protein
VPLDVELLGVQASKSGRRVTSCDANFLPRCRSGQDRWAEGAVAGSKLKRVALIFLLSVVLVFDWSPWLSVGLSDVVEA